MADDAADENEFANIPNNLQEFVKAVGFANIENMAEDEQAVYDKIREGKCMTCYAPLGDNANFIINRFGIVGGYCSGQCHSDMAVLGWIQEQHQDILDAVAFRGGGGDEGTK